MPYYDVTLAWYDNITTRYLSPSEIKKLGLPRFIMLEADSQRHAYQKASFVPLSHPAAVKEPNLMPVGIRVRPIP